MSHGEKEMKKWWIVFELRMLINLFKMFMASGLNGAVEDV